MIIAVSARARLTNGKFDRDFYIKRRKYENSMEHYK